MRKILIFVLIILLYMIIHEGAHVVVSAIFGEFQTIRWNVIGPEVVFKTPVALRSGLQWAFISGVSNLITILIGYILLLNRKKLGQMPSLFARGFAYFLTVVLLVADPLNLSIGPFFYGGDANGIAEGLSINRYFIQIVFFILLLINRELIAAKLLPAYAVKSDHLIFRPWVMKAEQAKP